MSADDARYEAERITMYTEDRGRSEWLFVAGAQWATSRPFTEEDVATLAAALPCVWRMREAEHPHGKLCIKEGACLDQSRAALAAVQARNTARHNPETGGSQ